MRDVHAARRASSGSWQAPIAKRDSLIPPDRVVLLGTEHRIDAQLWHDASLPRLARYQLHYFDDLCSSGAEHKVEWHQRLLAQWLAGTPTFRGDAWDPYPTSLRVVNWIKWALTGNDLSQECERSLLQQAEWLCSRVEYDLLGNHVFENAKALVFAGSYFSADRSARRWLAAGWRILTTEISEQVMNDGGHFERSPMYHALILEGLLDLLNVARHFGLPPPLDVAAVCSRMLTWLEAMTHPDGRVALFNDATLDGAPPHSSLREYAGRLGVAPAIAIERPLHHLAATGYARVSLGPAVCMLDVAALGPDYLPAHGHADTLTFELSLGGQRVIVDTGVSTYEVGETRNRERSTAAHNTWSVDGANSSDVWAAFRVGRRARVRAVRHAVEGREVHFQAEHDGYQHLPCRAVHRRKWRFEERALTVLDEFDGRGTVRLAGALHFHPSTTLLRKSQSDWQVQRAGGEALLEVTPDAGVRATADRYDYAPNFGETYSAPALRFSAEVRLPARIETRIVYCTR